MFRLLQLGIQLPILARRAQHMSIQYNAPQLVHRRQVIMTLATPRSTPTDASQPAASDAVLNRPLADWERQCGPLQACWWRQGQSVGCSCVADSRRAHCNRSSILAPPSNLGSKQPKRSETDEPPGCRCRWAVPTGNSTVTCPPAPLKVATAAICEAGQAHTGTRGQSDTDLLPSSLPHRQSLQDWPTLCDGHTPPPDPLTLQHHAGVTPASAVQPPRDVR